MPAGHKQTLEIATRHEITLSNSEHFTACRHLDADQLLHPTSG